MKRASLQIKVMASLSAMILIGFFSIICFNILAQEKSVKQEVQNGAHIVADTVMNGITYPMAQGDSDAVRNIMVNLKKDMQGGEVYVFGQNKVAVFTSEKEKAGKDVMSLIQSPELAAAIPEALKSGKAPDRVYEESVNGKSFLTILQPIAKEERCSQCHPENEAVRGGMIVRQSLDAMYANLARQKYQNILIGFTGAALIVLILYFVIAKLVIGPINRVVGNLTEHADQLGSSADMVASSSQSLAEGATEQAASIEETSASLEEMTSMTKMNAENADQADKIMKEANQAVSRATGDMTGLTNSMTEITKASEETSKIIKTIDEIAFQTNLLALNAAVEAARAGEAGAGFAVVANEVRNLAMRAAEAARNTASLIEGTVLKVREGSEAVARTNEDFSELAQHTQKSGQLADEIRVASQEQAQGIDQISRAVLEMDKVVQTNAAGAEESSAASQELNHLADGMRGAVAELIAVVTGSASANGNGHGARALLR